MNAKGVDDLVVEGIAEQPHPLVIGWVHRSHRATTSPSTITSPNSDNCPESGISTDVCSTKPGACRFIFACRSVLPGASLVISPCPVGPARCQFFTAAHRKVILCATGQVTLDSRAAEKLSSTRFR